MHPTTALLFFGLSSLSSIEAATYVSPEKSAILFKADQLPIDTDTMKELAKKLVVLAARDNTNHSPEELRATSQLLAIAHRLNPQLDHINLIDRALSEDQLFPKSDANELHQAKSNIWALVGLLAKQEAGEQANLLSRCIKDPLSVIDSKHPELANHQRDPKLWNDIVAPLESFNPKPIPQDDPPEQPKHDEPTDEPKQPEVNPNPPQQDDQPQAKKHVWKLAKGNIYGPALYQIRDRQGELKHRIDLLNYKVSIKAEGNKGNKNLLLTSSPPFDNCDHMKSIEHELHQVLKTRWKEFDDVSILVQLSHAYSSENYESRNALAPLAILLDSSLANKPMRGNLLVHAAMSTNGTFYRPKNYWNYISYLSEQSGKYRILVPSEAEGDFRQLIALNKPEFFIKHEIIVVKNLEESAKYYSTQDDSSIAEATALFSEIQKVAGNNRAIGPLAANPHVRARLSKILDIMPNHLSAKMLFLQGGGNRPTTMESAYLGYELRSILEEMRWVTDNHDAKHINSSALYDTHDKMDARMKIYERFVDSRDRYLCSEISQTISKIRLLGKAAKSASTEEGNYHTRKAKRYLANIKSDYHRYKKSIANLTKNIGQK